MSSAAAVLVTQEGLRLALAEWQAQRQEAEREFAAHEVRLNRDRAFARVPSDFADEVAPYFFTLLEKYAKPLEA
ncbi:MAG: hypothetical protein IPM64_17735 [Phycisphaerales bacterium]|nr:hypothetical protein [Phycisphaerales bacterium]